MLALLTSLSHRILQFHSDCFTYLIASVSHAVRSRSAAADLVGPPIERCNVPKSTRTGSYAAGLVDGWAAITSLPLIALVQKSYSSRIRKTMGGI